MKLRHHEHEAIVGALLIEGRRLTGCVPDPDLLDGLAELVADALRSGYLPNLVPDVGYCDGCPVGAL